MPTHAKPTEPTPRLRAATPSDAGPIARLQVTAWRAAYRNLLPDEVLRTLSVNAWTERRREQIASPSNPEIRHWVLEDGTGLFGWASTGLARDEEPAARVHELFALYLDPQRVGEGHGRRLMTHCLSDATQRGFGEIVLWVIEGNEPARRFYAAAGFDLDEDTEPQPYRDTGTLQVRLKRSLSEPVPFMTG